MKKINGMAVKRSLRNQIIQPRKLTPQRDLILRLLHKPRIELIAIARSEKQEKVITIEHRA